MADIRVPTLDEDDEIPEHFVPGGFLPTATNDGYVLTSSAGAWIEAPIPSGGTVIELRSPDNTLWQITVTDAGVLEVNEA